MVFGPLVKRHRLSLRMSLRTFCLKFNHDPSNWSKMERGVIPPPQKTEILKKYAENLGIKYGSNDWYEFIDAASADSGIIPRDIMTDDELVATLPMFFRTIRNEKPTKKELLDFAEHLWKHP